MQTTPGGAMDLDQVEPNGHRKREIEDTEDQAPNDELSEHSTKRNIPPWTRHVTARGVIASAVIGAIYSIIAMKLNLTTGLSSNLNVSVALLAFIFIRTWTKLLEKLGVATMLSWI